MVGVLVPKVRIGRGHPPVLQPRDGIFAMELAIVGIAGVAPIGRPNLHPRSLVAPDHGDRGIGDRPVRLCHDVGLIRRPARIGAQLRAFQDAGCASLLKSLLRQGVWPHADSHSRSIARASLFDRRRFHKETTDVLSRQKRLNARPHQAIGLQPRRPIGAFWQPDRAGRPPKVPGVTGHSGTDLRIDGRVARKQR